MVSYSFCIPNGKDVDIIDGRIENPIKIIKSSTKNLQIKFIDEQTNLEVCEHRGKNSSFSIVYNK